MKRAAVFVTALGIAVVALIMGAQRSGGMTRDVWAGLEQVLFYVSLGIGTFGGYMLLAAVLHAWTGRTAWLLIFAGCTLVYLVVTYWVSYTKSQSAVAWAVQAVTQPPVTVPFFLLAVSRFAKRWEWVRKASMGLVFFTALCHMPSPWWYGPGAQLARSGLFIVDGVVLLLAAWHIAFRPIGALAARTRDVPPVDLKCPRCATGLRLVEGAGDCPHCRLRISMTFADALCEKCQYPLRGLTSERCPECGAVAPLALVNSPETAMPAPSSVVGE